MDPDLATANIRAGVTIFGTAGDPNVVNTGSGTATAADILIGKKAWATGTEVTGTRNPIPVGKTWQKICYNIDRASIACAGTGQDGAWQKGVEPPNPRFTDNLNGTVTDNATGLIWLKNAGCYATQSWTTAVTSANSLASGACGLTDGSTAGQWRLPNIKEMQSLIDCGKVNGNPALPSGHPFSGVIPCLLLVVYQSPER